jgi:hypothetical protein
MSLIEWRSKKSVAHRCPDQRRDPRWFGPCIDMTKTLFDHPVSEECHLVRPISNRMKFGIREERPNLAASERRNFDTLCQFTQENHRSSNSHREICPPLGNVRRRALPALGN